MVGRGAAERIQRAPLNERMQNMTSNRTARINRPGTGLGVQVIKTRREQKTREDHFQTYVLSDIQTM